ncbi:MAG TPA: hypothetical protein VNA30_02880 [Mycobacteriales bacterium]|nr:hypothetical protein [Mycobacteriales bacterium]
MRRRLAVALAVVCFVLLPTAAWAHPLGNFTVNTADRITVTADGVEVLHVIDLAEVPTVQLRSRVDTDNDRSFSPAELAAYADAECAAVRPQLSLEVDVSPAPLRLVAADGASRPGQAGLKTTRVECRFFADQKPRKQVGLTDRAAAARNGWKEVTATTLCGRVVTSDVPEQSSSGLLASYPEDLLSSPLQVTAGTMEVDPGPCRDAGDDGAAGAVAKVLPRGADRATQAFSDLVGREKLGLPLALAALALSVVFGIVHALAPGHGKTVMAAYLVGQRGTRRQALWLGATVTLTHTVSVLALGALLTLGSIASPERVVPVTEVLSGALLVALGGYLLLLAVRRRRALGGPDHDHDHDHAHDHDHDHGHDHPHPHHDEAHDHPHPHDHDHHHATAPSATAAHSHGGFTHTHAPLPDRLTWKSLAAMGVAGGLVPSPSALVVLLGATALGRAPFGVLLVLGYGLGMAVTLTLAGLLLLRAQDALAARGWSLLGIRRLGRWLPGITATVVVLVGGGLVLRGVTGL